MKYEIELSPEDLTDLIRKELLDLLGGCLKEDHEVDADFIDNPVLIGALVTVIKAYSTPAQLSDLVELMQADL